MPVIDKTQPKPRKPRPDARPPAPYQIHRPDVAAIDAQPRAGDPLPFSIPIGSPYGPLDNRKIPRS